MSLQVFLQPLVATSVVKFKCFLFSIQSSFADKRDDAVYENTCGYHGLLNTGLYWLQMALAVVKQNQPEIVAFT